MRHIVRGIVLSFVILCAVAGCSQHSLRCDMKKFMSMRIDFPSELMMVADGKISFGQVGMGKPAMVFFYGNGECSSCVIDHLKDDLTGFVDIEQSGKCKVVVLFSPPEDDSMDVQEKIRGLEFHFPIYVDLYGDFYRENKKFGLPIRDYYIFRTCTSVL